MNERVPSPELAAVLKDAVQAEVEKAALTACQYALAHDGELLVCETLGDAPVDARFLIMSTSKVLVPTVVWQLIGEGRLDPALPVTTWWREFGKNGKGAITLEHIMTHTAGIPGFQASEASIFDRATRVGEIEDWAVEWEPGTRYAYHGTSAHWVLAELVERLTGEDWRAEIRSRVLDPLGLDRLELGVPLERQGDIPPFTFTGELPTPEEIRELLGDDVVVPAASANPGTQFDVFTMLSRPDILEAGVPGASGVSDAASLALLYQHLMHDPKGLWDRDVLRDATQTVRSGSLGDNGRPALRSLGLEMAGEGPLHVNSIGAGVTSPQTFGHWGAGGQLTWADPVSGLSFAFVTNCFDINVVRQYRRGLNLTRAIAAAG